MELSQNMSTSFFNVSFKEKLSISLAGILTCVFLQ